MRLTRANTDHRKSCGGFVADLDAAKLPPETLKGPRNTRMGIPGESAPRQGIMESCEAGRPRIIRIEHRMHLQIVHGIAGHRAAVAAGVEKHSAHIPAGRGERRS